MHQHLIIIMTNYKVLMHRTYNCLYRDILEVGTVRNKRVMYNDQPRSDMLFLYTSLINRCNDCFTGTRSVHYRQSILFIIHLRYIIIYGVPVVTQEAVMALSNPNGLYNHLMGCFYLVLDLCNH